jgi:HNH endonuclease
MPEAHVSRHADAETRFWAKVARGTADECWLWTGNIDEDGYGIFCPVGRKPVRAHRFVYELANGTIAPALVIDHVRARGCTHRNCVNPAHLEPVTNVENVLRGDSPAARSARALTCIRDHPLSGDNLRITRSGKRSCRQCERDRTRDRQQRRRAGLVQGAPLCSIDSCERLAAARGLCDMHYQQQSRAIRKEKEAS